MRKITGILILSLLVLSLFFTTAKANPNEDKVIMDPIIILPTTIKSSDIQLSKTIIEFSNEMLEKSHVIYPEFKVIVKGKKLKIDKDYTVIVENGDKPGKAKLIITGIGNYTGEAEKEYQIIPNKKQNIKSGKIDFHASSTYINSSRGFTISLTTIKKVGKTSPETVNLTIGKIKKAKVSISNKKIAKVSIVDKEKIFLNPIKSGKATIIYSIKTSQGTFKYKIPVVIHKTNTNYHLKKLGDSISYSKDDKIISKFSDKIKAGKYCDYKKTKNGVTLKYNPKKKKKHTAYLTYHDDWFGGASYFAYILYFN